MSEDKKKSGTQTDTAELFAKNIYLGAIKAIVICDAHNILS